ncbi:tubulin tyrosine ligase protein, partial [Perkinsela sp. CCAP 1560/4]
MSTPRAESCGNASVAGINKCDSVDECLKSLKQFERHPFPCLPDVDEGKVVNLYEKPIPLYMGKFVSDVNREQAGPLPSSPMPPTDQEIKLEKRLVTERAIPVVFSGETKCVRYTVCKQLGCIENLPEYLVFSPARFRQKSDTAALRALWKLQSERKPKNSTAALQTRIVDVQYDNADKLCLYKMGPGVVAFRVVITTFHTGGLRHTVDDNWNLFWGKRIGPEEWARANIYQRINHFPGSKNIGRKDLLHWNILKARKTYPADYDFSPPTFVLPHEALMFQRYRMRYGEVDQTYIVKPVASSCGKGIYLTSSISLPWRHKKSIVQQYIPQPLLIDGRKFDLRIYVALTSIQPLRLYVFDEGLVRLSPEAYPGDTSDLTSIHKHVTNYSINKHCVTTDGAEIKWNLTRLKAWLCEKYSDGNDKWIGIQNSIQAIVVKTFAAVSPEMMRQGKIHMPHDARMQGCFELFGFDLLLDTSFKMFLLEVNIMPS